MNTLILKLMGYNIIKYFLLSILLYTLSAYADTNNQLISLDFQNIEIRAALTQLADFGHINIVMDDSVQGTIALHLHNIPWNEALDIILKTHQLTKKQDGQTFLISKTIIDSNKTNSAKNSDTLELVTIPLQYATAKEMEKMLANNKEVFFSEFGHAFSDNRTNTLILQDSPENLSKIQTLIHSLDKPVQQITIEARIVTVNKDSERDLGIAFGLSSPNHLSGTLEGANKIAEGNAASSIPVNQRLNIDFSADSTSGSTPASIGIALAKLGKGILLDLELSALESIGEGKIIASPRLVTANQQPAFIESGEEIPYQESTLSGATATEFKKAVLRLKVTPQITANQHIMLTLDVVQSMPNGILVNGVPELSTKEIQTRVRVANGETLVLGGIYREDKIHSVERVPFLSDIPGLGSLFQKQIDKVDTEELLIFITPRIL